MCVFQVFNSKNHSAMNKYDTFNRYFGIYLVCTFFYESFINIDSYLWRQPFSSICRLCCVFRHRLPDEHVQPSATHNISLFIFLFIYIPKGVFWPFMDLEKTYDTIDRQGMRQMLRVCGVKVKLLKAVQRFYVDSRACVRVGNDLSEWFQVNGGLRQCGVISPSLFNIYMDGAVREVNVRVLGEGLELLSANGGRFEINQLLFADDTALVADSEEKLCRVVSEFGRVCERRKLRVNVGKSKVMRCSRYGIGDRMHVILNGEPLEEVDCFKYLWS